MNSLIFVSVSFCKFHKFILPGNIGCKIKQLTVGVPSFQTLLLTKLKKSIVSGSFQSALHCGYLHMQVCSMLHKVKCLSKLVFLSIVKHKSISKCDSCEIFLFPQCSINAHL